MIFLIVEDEIYKVFLISEDLKTIDIFSIYRKLSNLSL